MNVPGRAVARIARPSIVQSVRDNIHSGSHGNPKKNIYQLRSIWAGLRISVRDMTRGCGQFNTASRSTRSGW